MRKSILFLAIIIIASCTKKSSGPNIPSAPNKFLSISFPHIDTATLWHNINGQRTGAKALIKSNGEIVITGYAGSRGTYAGGTYSMQELGTPIGYPIYFGSFNLYQYGPDSVISKFNSLQIIQTTGWAKSYYMLQISGGNLPDYSIVSGIFIDSI